ncbi:MAG: histidine--tRNA ligase [Acidimicrobiia bacterium]
MSEAESAPERTDVYRAPVGTRDVLPPESERWTDVVARFADRAARYGFGLVITPIFEHREVFVRVGEHTDVVRKEMYDFDDKGGRRIALRPEGTASVVRAYAQHRPTPPWKTWYVAPNYRYERPQKGRYRQHFQLGVEVLGVDDPDVDVEVIDLAYGFLRELGVPIRLLVNSMGDVESRAAHREALLEYFRAHAVELGAEFAERAEANPLRLLDAKNPEWQAVLDRAPKLPDYLNDESRAALERVQRGLDALGIEYELAPRLVRGFDYYTGTTFEFVSDALDAAQSTVCGGGRYDQLVEQMGGPPTPGIGFGMGIERVLIALDESGPALEPRGMDAFVVDAIGDGSIVELVHQLRALGLRTDRAYGGRSMKAQMKVADRSGATWVVVLGAKEAERGVVAVKNMVTGEQREVLRADVGPWLVTAIAEGTEGTA